MKRLLTLSSLLFVMIVNIACSGGEKASTGNPLLDEWNTEFGVPPFDLIRTEHFKPAFEAAMLEHNQEIAKSGRGKTKTSKQRRTR